ncbi:MAG: hypothetical protein HY303_16945 [Candidatus Wallbacteria bacterium]|nr:hypothetical protein [Candidatus Wallbacteria bacterium]
MYRKTVAVLVLVLVLYGRAEARIEIAGHDQPPVNLDDATADRMLHIALYNTYKTLAASKRVYKIKFESADEIRAETNAPDEFLVKLGAFLEKDVNSQGQYTIHVSRYYIDHDLAASVQKAGEAYSSLAPEEQERRKQLGARILAFQLIGHEAQHAMQVERGEVGFLDNLVAPAIHDKIGHDRYDEFAGYKAQREVRYVNNGKVPADKAEEARQGALTDTNKEYSHLGTRFLVVRGGKETEGRAPFPWPDGGDSGKNAQATKDVAKFFKQLVDQKVGGKPAAQKANSQLTDRKTGRAARARGEEGDSEVEAIGGNAGSDAGTGGDPVAGADGTDNGEQADSGASSGNASEVFGDPGFDIDASDSMPVDALAEATTTNQMMPDQAATGNAPPEDTGATMAAGQVGRDQMGDKGSPPKPKRPKFNGKDPSASKVDPPPGP